MELIHKRGYYADKANSPLAQFWLKDGTLLQFRVVVPSKGYAREGRYGYVTYIPFEKYRDGRREAIGSGRHGRPLLREIKELHLRYATRVVKPQRRKFKRFCRWLEKNAKFTTGFGRWAFNRRQVGFIRDLLTIKGNYYFRKK